MTRHSEDDLRADFRSVRPTDGTDRLVSAIRARPCRRSHVCGVAPISSSRRGKCTPRSGGSEERSHFHPFRRRRPPSQNRGVVRARPLYYEWVACCFRRSDLCGNSTDLSVSTRRCLDETNEAMVLEWRNVPVPISSFPPPSTERIRPSQPLPLTET